MITDSVVADALPSEFVVKKAVATSEHHLQDHRETVAAISSISTVDSASYSYALSKSDTGEMLKKFFVQVIFLNQISKMHTS